MNKSILLFFILNLNLAANENQQIGCLQKYKNSLKKKEDQYQKAYKRYKQNHNAAQSAVISDGYIGTRSSGGLIGSLYLQNASAPRRSDYDMFEQDIITAVEADLSKYISLKPTVLEGIYNAAYEKYSDVTFQKIQDLVKLGFENGKFCGLLGKRRTPGVKRFVLSELKKQSKESVNSREPAVVNFKEDGKEYHPDKDDELNRPLENIKPE